MNINHIRSLDLNLLVIAAALYHHKNVSKAAEEMGISQSAVSHALGRLRDQFKDPFFVRTSKGIAPTEYARTVQSEIMEIVQRIEFLSKKRSAFVPFEAEGRITVASTDYFEVLVMPALQAVLTKEAPKVQISLRPTRGELPKRELEEGLIDLGIAGFYRDLPGGFFQQKLFTDDFSCAAGKGHPSFGSKSLSQRDFLTSRHALITLQGDFRLPKSTSNEEPLIAYGSYSFTGMAWVLQNSSLLLTAPTKLLRAYQKYFPLQIWPSPEDEGKIDIRMVWHEQTHSDPLRVWLRSRIKSIVESISSNSGEFSI